MASNALAGHRSTPNGRDHLQRQTEKAPFAWKEPGLFLTRWHAIGNSSTVLTISHEREAVVWTPIPDCYSYGSAEGFCYRLGKSRRN